MRFSPSVTVLMPVCNTRRYLLAALRSIMEQDFDDFELLVVDDGSTDDSPRILGLVDDPRLRVIRQEHSGIVPSLNRGLAEARGELVARMDADDLADGRRLGQQVRYMRAHPDVGLLGTRFMYIDGRGRQLFSPAWPCDDAAIRQALPTYNCFTHSTVMFRKADVMAVGGYRPAMWFQEDYDLWLRLIERTRAAQLPEVLLSYRLWYGSFTHHNRVGMSTLWDAVVKELARQRADGGQDVLDATGSMDALLRRLESAAPRRARRRKWAHHMVRLGKACLEVDRRGPAFRFASEAVWHDPLSRWTWMVLLRCLLPEWLRACNAWVRDTLNGRTAGESQEVQNAV